MIPKPFTKITVVYSEPALVAATSAREAEDEAPQFETLLSDAVTAAERA
jgi:lysophospholipid acyltransferase (LPLAT)-like uncharacterized protein